MKRSMLSLCLGLLTAACIQMPSERQEVADLRPHFSFALADSRDDASAYRVYVDGLDMGSAASYMSGRNSLKVISGTHLVKVEGRGRVVFEERVYLGDGATRTIMIPHP